MSTVVVNGTWVTNRIGLVSVPVAAAVTVVEVVAAGGMATGVVTAVPVLTGVTVTVVVRVETRRKACASGATGVSTAALDTLARGASSSLPPPQALSTAIWQRVSARTAGRRWDGKRKVDISGLSSTTAACTHAIPAIPRLGGWRATGHLPAD